MLTPLTRYGELGQLAGAGTSDRFPPLRELILRRLRGHSDTPQQKEEIMSWMVDQLTTYHEFAATAEAEPDQMEPGTLPPMAPGPSRDLYSGIRINKQSLNVMSTSIKF